MNRIYLEPNQVPSHLRGSYLGKKFAAIVTATMTIPADAGLWSGGSREKFRAVLLSTGADTDIPGQERAPWDKTRQEQVVTLQPGFAIVRHSHFCGDDMGLLFYVHPNDAAKLLPAPSAELSPYERLVLTATRSLKSSYGGRDRYQMARDEYECKKALGTLDYPTRAQWDETKAALVSKGLLNKAGAITPAGRNAAR